MITRHKPNRYATTGDSTPESARNRRSYRIKSQLRGMHTLIVSIQRVIDADAAGAIATRDKAGLPEIEVDSVFELRVDLPARTLGGDLDIGQAMQDCIPEGELSAPHEL